MKSLVLTLGHNSSAILVEDGIILAGYEEERLSGIKSDSAFPIRAIMRLQELYQLPKTINICVSHWFLDGRLPDRNKYWDSDYLHTQFPNAELLSLDRKNFTHHDAHMESAEVFAGDDFPQDHHVFVVDGFGTQGECISVYHKVSGCEPTLIHRVHGFHKSVGLLYQYATDYCGMKMHQDEWKMLGYEVHVGGSEARRLDQLVIESLPKIDSSEIESDLGDLVQVKDDVFRILQGVAEDYRPQIAYFVQRFTEQVLQRLFQMILPTNLIVVGGCFYNVKVNSMLADMTPGKFCAMPLAGDQGAGLGVYQHYFHDLKWPGHLFWGNRDRMSLGETRGFKSGDVDAVARELDLYNIVNVIRGPMEFGPRALCNTSTLALPPTTYNVDVINQMNGRDTVMPMALVVTEDQANNLFEDVDKIHRSLEYMIVTRRFRPGKQISLEGGAHHYPLTGEWTCRPQITKDPFMLELLRKFGPLINTSANVHGQPIVWNQKQIEFMHEFQRKTFPVSTIFVED